MRYDIIFSLKAHQDIGNLNANIRAVVRDAIETHLRYEPAKVSKSRIKRLQGISHPQFRLRVGDVRVYYDVREGLVMVHAVLMKSEGQNWVNQFGGDS
ncbi:MAG: hypothetical protein JXB15_05955 [Anaerolineales bacterium]|nr:hypothetical protein [Anaerolineales bacterium]